jgi:hypothetical protein
MKWVQGFAKCIGLKLASEEDRYAQRRCISPERFFANLGMQRGAVHGITLDLSRAPCVAPAVASFVRRLEFVISSLQRKSRALIHNCANSEFFTTSNQLTAHFEMDWT